MKKIAWVEGILLGQQHLQQWDHYHHARQDFLAHLSQPFAWGIKKLIWDEESLLYGKLMIKNCEIVFPTGQIIIYDSRCESPLSYMLTASHENKESIYLAVPLSPYIKDITGYPARQGATAWTGVYDVIVDEEDADREREVLFAHPNLYLLSSKEDHNAFHVIKIAEVIKKNITEFAREPHFIPSCVALNASDELLRIIDRHIERLSSKVHLFHTRSQHSALGWKEHGLLQLFTTALNELHFFKSCPLFHPMELYRMLLRLLGALIPNAPPPFYDHHHLSEVFSTLDNLLKQGIEQAIPSRMAMVTWVRESEWLYTTEMIDARHFTKSGFYLAVTMDAPVMEWLSHFIHQVKVGARSAIDSIVSSALMGVVLQHVQRPPTNLPIKSGHEYFYLEPKGVFWEQIKAEKILSLFVSQNFSQAQIELVVVEEEDVT